MSEFLELYKQLSISDLLEIIHNKSSYKTSAIETAKKEITNRNLSEDQLYKAQKELEHKLIKKQRIIEKRQYSQDRIKLFFENLFNELNPIKEKSQSESRIIKMTIIVFSIISIFRIYNGIDSIKFLFSIDVQEWDISVVEILIHLILLPIAIYFFIKRKKIGWILLTINLLYSSISAFTILIISLQIPLEDYYIFNHILAIPQPISLAVSFLFFGSFVWVISKKKVRDVFNISKEMMIKIIGIFGLLTMIYFVLLLHYS